MKRKVSMIRVIRILYCFLLIPLTILIHQLNAYASRQPVRALPQLWDWILLALIAHVLFGAAVGLVVLLSHIGQKGAWKIEWIQLIVAAMLIAAIIWSLTQNIHIFQPHIAPYLAILCGYLIISSFRKKQEMSSDKERQGDVCAVNVENPASGGTHQEVAGDQESASEKETSPMTNERC